MNTIEIHRNMKYLVPITVLLVLALLYLNYFIFFWDRSKDQQFAWKVFTALMSIVMIIAIYKFGRQIITNEPVLVFTKDTLTIYNERLPATFHWNEITSWSITTEEDTPYLTIEAPGKKERLNISWLDKKPDEIAALISSYK
jgi:hypothetical protein